MPKNTKSTPSNKQKTRLRPAKRTAGKSTGAREKAAPENGAVRRRGSKKAVSTAAPEPAPDERIGKAASKRSTKRKAVATVKPAESPAVANETVQVPDSAAAKCSSPTKKPGTTKKKTNEAQQVMASERKAAVREDIVHEDTDTYFEDTLSEDLITIDRRRGRGRRKSDAVPSDAPEVPKPKLERRAKVNRRRQIDPTTCERDYTDEEIEFMNAIDEYKRTSGRMFPTCSEVLEVLRNLGYRKGKTPAEAETGHAFQTDPAAAETVASAVMVPTWDQNEAIPVASESIPCV